ncbi:MAG: DUF2948 family protein [Caulobacteraceae bacterium]|nr:DUF2948 family protein [Caulobacteraceae bacterium]
MRGQGPAHPRRRRGRRLTAKTRPLRLLAEDEADLALISGALQDAVTRVGDIRWERDGRRLTLAFRRLRWEADETGAPVSSAVQLGGVLGVRARRLKPDARDEPLQLLALTFIPGEPPGGVVTFHFSDGDLAAEVECIDAALADFAG